MKILKYIIVSCLLLLATGHTLAQQPGTNWRAPISIGPLPVKGPYPIAYYLDTSLYSNDYTGRPTNDVFFSFTADTDIKELNIQLTSTAVSPVCVYLFDSSHECIASHISSSGTGAIARILTPLAAGFYYVVMEGYNQNGMIYMILNATMGTEKTEYKLGTKDAPFIYTHTQDTRLCTNYNKASSYSDVYYKFTTTKTMDITISHCGSAIADTYVQLLDSVQTCIAYNDDYKGPGQCSSTTNAYLKVNSLPPGTYSVVSEGRKQNGKITTTIEGVVVEDEPVEEEPSGMGVGDVAHNYIHTRTYTTADSTRFMENVQYFDGLGRPESSILVGASPLGKDIITRQDYDVAGRPSCSWLPRTSTFDRGTYVASADFEALPIGIYNNDTRSYSESIYEASPLNRVTKQYGPGMAWKEHPVDIRYVALDINSFTSSSISDNYLGTCTTNEDGNSVYEFTDGLGRVFLTSQMDGKTPYSTGYQYDNYDNLVQVVPPLVSTNPSAASMYDVIYFYHYDNLHRCIYKKLPGADAIYYIYDRGNRQVFSQDGEQRRRGEWKFAVADVLGRTVLEGTCLNRYSYGDTCLHDANVRASHTSSDTPFYGYVIEGVTLVSPEVYSVNYYDDYSFIKNNGFPSTLDYVTPPVSYGTRYTGGYKGLQTGHLAARIDSSGVVSYTHSAYYYDYRGRMIQSRSTNHLGGMDTEFLEYGFAGEILKRQRVHTAMGKATQTETYTYSYDHAGRLLTTKHQLNGGLETTLVDNEYDELGRLKSDNRNGQSQLKTNYTYNVRSWMKSISNPLFSQNLYYTSGIGKPCYNGNINSMDWKTSADSDIRGYRFEYDALSRLKNAVYGEGKGLSANAGRFNEQITDYDANGNILGLKRCGQTSANGYGLIDNLTFSLNGNQLKNVTDSVSVSAFGGGFDFKDGSREDVEYSYDGNGNLAKDLNKNIVEIQYNYLNLPCYIKFADGNSISYVYDAKGKKFRTTHIMGNDTTVTDYCGNVIYENGVAQTLLVEGGYVSLSDRKYHFYLQDHQGNNRVVADEEGDIEEVNHYYPFGGTFANSSSVQPYKYNGKELDRKCGLDWYDYGARHYDASLGRWHVMDLMSEKYYGASPYVYCLNNPVLLIDPNGKWPTWGGIKESLNATLGAGLSFANGAVRAVADNMLLGTTSLRETGIYSSASAYNAGQDIGDVLSIFIGGAEVVTGAGEVTVGGLGTPATAGTSLVISAKGLVDVTHGSLMSTSGAMKLFSRKGRVSKSNESGYSKTSGKNEPHSNFKAREAAREKMEAAQEKLKAMKNDRKSTRNEKEEVRKEIEHWKRKMDNTGETHHRNK